MSDPIKRNRAPGVASVFTSHARHAAHAAASLGWSWRALDGDEGYLFEISDGARRAVLAAGSATPFALNHAAGYSIARDKAFTAAALEHAGVATIPSRLFFLTNRHAEQRAPGGERADALAYAAAAHYPLFAKPNAGARGEHAEIIADANAFADYLGRLAPSVEAVVVQPLVRGREYRVGVLDGEALFAYAKTAPFVVGDGLASLAALHAGDNRGAACFEDESGAALAPGTILAPGACARVLGPANRAVGGGAEDFAAPAPAPLSACALRAAAVLGLRLAGVDIFDVSPARDLSDLVVIEVNASPAFATLEELGRDDLIERIWIANLRAALA